LSSIFGRLGSFLGSSCVVSCPCGACGGCHGPRSLVVGCGEKKTMTMMDDSSVRHTYLLHSSFRRCNILAASQQPFHSLPSHSPLTHCPQTTDRRPQTTHCPLTHCPLTHCPQTTDHSPFTHSLTHCPQTTHCPHTVHRQTTVHSPLTHSLTHCPLTHSSLTHPTVGS